MQAEGSRAFVQGGAAVAAARGAREAGRDKRRRARTSSRAAAPPALMASSSLISAAARGVCVSVGGSSGRFAALSATDLRISVAQAFTASCTTPRSMSTFSGASSLEMSTCRVRREGRR